MSTPILPYAVWASGTLQNSIPSNDNSRRSEMLNRLVISDSTTAQPGSPAEGDIYILAATHTGAQWAGFVEDDIVIFNSGTWHAVAPVDGVVVNFSDAQKQWTTAGGWLTLSGGGSGGTELRGLTFTSDTGSTADTDPGAGLFKWNNATEASATVLFFDNSTADGVSLATFWAGLAATGYVLIVQGDDETRWQLWKWSSVTDGTGYRKLAAVIQATSASAIVDNKLCYCDFSAGATSSGGSASGLSFTSDTGSTADTDPGAGLFKWNNATQASATILYFDNSTSDGVSLATYWAGLPATGYLLIVQGSDSTRWQLWKWSSVTDGTGYRKLAVALQAVSASAIVDNETCFCDFDTDADSGASAATITGTAMDSFPPTTNAATLGVLANNLPTLQFDGVATNESARWLKQLPSGFTGTLDFTIKVVMESATTGNVRFGAQVMRLNADISVDSFDTAVEAHVAVAGDIDDPTTITLSSVGVDGATGSDWVVIEVYRDASDTTNDTATGLAYLYAWSAV